MDDVVRAGQVQARAARLERDEEDGDVRAVVEAVHLFEAVLAGAVQIAEGDLRELQPLADDLEHLHELREDQHLVAALHDLHDHVLEGVELAGRQVVGEAGQVDLEQARMAADLAQLEQGVQDGHLALGQALFVHVGQHLGAQLAGQGGVELGLGLFQRAAGDAFHLGRQVLGHFGLGTAQNEGPHAGAQVVQGLGVAVLDGLDDAALEGMLRTEEAGHQELEQAPELKEVVLDGRTGQAQAHAGMDAAHGAGRDGVGVLDVLGFVQDDGVELVFLHLLQVTPQQGVGGDDEVRFRDMLEHALAARAVDGQAAQAGHELFRFALPVGQHRGGHHDEVGALEAAFHHMLDEGQGLHGLAQAHLVGQNAAEAVFRQEVEVGQALQLVAAQIGLQRLWRRYGPHLAEGADLFAQVVPEGVRARAGQVFQQAVQHRRLELLELGLRRLAGVQAQGRELVGDLFQPGFGQAGVGAVLELHIALAAGPGLPDLVQGQGLAFVIHADLQREPLFLLVAHHLGRDGGLGRAHLVARKGALAVDAVVLHQRGVGVQQEGDGLFRLQEP